MNRTRQKDLGTVAVKYGKTVNINIDGHPVTVDAGTSILIEAS